ncbi:hypothetical protein EDC04DRAFT_2601070 [Pisolithus marmoratus]|nr:hypothetical protein EDC04DRAFT_2601070 [Pisolithus marmoratus]
MFSTELGLMSNGTVAPDLWDVISKVLMLLIHESEHHVTRLAIPGSDIMEMDYTDNMQASYGATLPPKASKEEVSECWTSGQIQAPDRQMVEMEYQMRAKEEIRETKESMEVDKVKLFVAKDRASFKLQAKLEQMCQKQKEADDNHCVKEFDKQMEQEQSGAAIAEPSTVTGGGNKLKDLRFNKLQKITKSVYHKPPPQPQPESSSSSNVQAKTKGRSHQCQVKVPPQVAKKPGSDDETKEDGSYEASFVDDHEEHSVEQSSSMQTNTSSSSGAFSTRITYWDLIEWAITPCNNNSGVFSKRGDSWLLITAGNGKFSGLILTRPAKLSKEVAATQDHDEIVDLLNKVCLGWGLICVATADDLSHGPQLVCQAYNPQPISHSLVCKMHNNMTAEGLANHMMVQAIQTGIKPSMIAEGLLKQPKTTPYTNHVKWSSHAKGPGAKMSLINGNHQVTLMQWIYKKDIAHFHQAQMAWQDAKNECEKADAEKQIEKYLTRLSEHAVWLVKFFDLGMFGK